MFREFTQVRQEPGGGHRRWFESDGLDLIVWFGADESVTGFQLCYDVGQGDHALTWRPKGKLEHHRIDLGDGGPESNLAPILTPAGPVPWETVISAFDRQSGSLEATLRTLVTQQLTHGRSDKKSGAE